MGRLRPTPARHSLTPEAFAAQQAERWKNGLAEWDQDGSRIARLRAAADFRLYTPGSRAGVPLALLNSLQRAGRRERRRRAHADHDDGLEPAGAGRPERRGAAQPRAGARRRHPRRRGAHARAGLAGRPPVAGRRDSEAAVRHGSACSISRRSTRPRIARTWRCASTACWPRPASTCGSTATRSTSARCCYTPEGKPRVAIVSIAHLGDTERMLVVSLLLSALLDWTRRQGGTSSLRAMLYMDEVFGYLPPGGQPAVESAAAHAAEAGARVRRRRRAGHAEPGGSRLQGAVEHRHVVPGQAADRARQGARARRPRRRDRGARSPGARRHAVGPQEPRVPDAQRPRVRRPWCSRPGGPCRTCAVRWAARS